MKPVRNRIVCVGDKLEHGGDNAGERCQGQIVGEIQDKGFLHLIWNLGFGETIFLLSFSFSFLFPPFP